jgi:hypothetical protein
LRGHNPQGQEVVYGYRAKARVIARDEILIKAPLTTVWKLFTSFPAWPRQIELANAFCRYLEMAEVV